MKHLSLLSFVGAALCILWACDPVDIDEPDNGKENGQGNKNDSTIVDWTDPDWYSVNFWDRTDRQKAGLRGPVKKWHIDTYTTYYEYEYDEAGHLIRESYVDTDDTDDNFEWLYTYDSNGHCIKAEYFDMSCDGEPSSYYVYEYENTGKYVAREWFMMGPGIVDANNGICKDLSKVSYVTVQPFSNTCRECTFTFDGDSLIIREYDYKIYNGTQERRDFDTLQYAFIYKDGYPVSLSTKKLRYQVENITYYPNGMYKDFVYLEDNAYNFDTGWDVHTYKMLDNPRYLEVDTFSLGGTTSYMTLTPQSVKVTYDSHYDLVRNEEWYTANTDTAATFTDTWTNYTYDKYGNWVTRDETIVARWTGQVSTSTITRVMEYFE